MFKYNGLLVFLILITGCKDEVSCDTQAVMNFYKEAYTCANILPVTGHIGEDAINSAMYLKGMDELAIKSGWSKEELAHIKDMASRTIGRQMEGFLYGVEVSYAARVTNGGKSELTKEDENTLKENILDIENEYRNKLYKENSCSVYEGFSKEELGFRKMLMVSNENYSSFLLGCKFISNKT
ncbi:hypothetical protein [Serratia entomophila]|uniref:hypothetical protein n=1 Tax=Serratia entomophila TaxID=42906 RepID=UPI00217B6DBD|nr:hypothetical protein [Serratia entomophila]CAI1123315.1 Uncharacterised protein [Serratia entomophila]CAI1851119.1 Uncharacterised protein [Serratia entomophila]CAI1855621.1 Uncharacterised protein [Serratia entomophila]CAI1922811.1 Uncharacterised protein [Serratia entomophila]CAI1953839.1 Uncharacterised protein [Serratia entomophila]